LTQGVAGRLNPLADRANIATSHGLASQ
jgi:hypothetical protein